MASAFYNRPFEFDDKIISEIKRTLTLGKSLEDYEFIIEQAHLLPFTTTEALSYAYLVSGSFFLDLERYFLQVTKPLMSLSTAYKSYTAEIAPENIQDKDESSVKRKEIRLCISLLVLSLRYLPDIALMFRLLGTSRIRVLLERCYMSYKTLFPFRRSSVMDRGFIAAFYVKILRYITEYLAGSCDIIYAVENMNQLQLVTFAIDMVHEESVLFPIRATALKEPSGAIFLDDICSLVNAITWMICLGCSLKTTPFAMFLFSLIRLLRATLDVLHADLNYSQLLELQKKGGSKRYFLQIADISTLRNLLSPFSYQWTSVEFLAMCPFALFSQPNLLQKFAESSPFYTQLVIELADVGIQMMIRHTALVMWESGNNALSAWDRMCCYICLCSWKDWLKTGKRQQKLLQLVSKWQILDKPVKTPLQVLQEVLIAKIHISSFAIICANPECKHPTPTYQTSEQNKRVQFLQSLPEDTSQIEKVFLLCSQCNLSRYCSTQCQREHWPQHKMMCKETKKIVEANEQV